jgi:hypothetical protein
LKVEEGSKFERLSFLGFTGPIQRSVCKTHGTIYASSGVGNRAATRRLKNQEKLQKEGIAGAPFSCSVVSLAGRSDLKEASPCTSTSDCVKVCRGQRLWKRLQF